MKQKNLRGINKFADLGTRSFFPDSLSAHFNSMDRYRSIAHFADYQVRSSLNRSQKDQWFALIKERLKAMALPKNSGSLSLAGGKHNLTGQIPSA